MRNELPMILRAAGGQDLDVNQTQSVDKMLKKMFAGISIGENVEKQLRTEILDVITSQTGSRSPLTFNELAEQVPALKELNATAEKAREVFLQYAEAQIEMNNRLAQASDRLASMLLKAAQLGIKADEIRLESALDLKGTFGETTSLEELQAPFQAQINGLVATAGGRPNMTPMEIGEAIASKQAELTAMSATPEQQTENLANGNIARLTKEINAYQTALDKLANSTSMADAAMKKIAEQERISEGRRQGVMGLLGMINDPERLFKFTQEQQSFGNVMSGDASLNDIARGIESLSLVEATNTPEDFQRILQQFVRNALNIAANAAGPQGAVITQLLQTVEKDFAVGAEERGKLNPELQAAIDSYTIAIETQVQAVETQQKLITQAASVQSDTIRQSAIEFKQQILTAARTAAQELEAAADRIGLKDTQDIEAGAQVDAKAAEEIAKAAEISANAFTEHAKTVKEAERTWYEFLTGWTGGATVATATLETTLIKPLEMMGKDVTRIRQEMNQAVTEGRVTSPSKPSKGIGAGNGGGGAGGWAQGGVVYASKGRLINFQPKGTDTVPAMLTPGEFVVRRSATQNNLGLLKAINSGANVTSDASTGTSYANRGGIISAKGYSFGGGVLNGVVSTLVGSGSDSLANVFNTFVKNFRSETNNFSDLINSLARVFPALNGPVNIFGTHIDKFNRTVSDLKKVEIKAPNIPEVIKFQGGTVRVELIAPADDFKLNAEDERRITKNLEERLVQLIGLGR